MHPKYLSQVLHDRGLPAPPMAQLEAFVGAMTDLEAPVMEECLRKLALGVEQQEDVEALLQGIKSAARPVSVAPVQRAQAATPEPLGREDVDEPATPTRPRARAPASSVPVDVLEMLRQHGMHVYSTSAALKIELGTLRAGEACGQLQYTVQVDAARAKHGGGYDWTSKVPFQFTRRELPLLAAHLLGLGTKKLSIGNHGPNTDKHFELEDQGSHLFVKVRVADGCTIALPVGPADVFGWGELCLVALQLNRPSVGADGHLALLRRIGRMEAPGE